jgi:hypothetical protein
MAMNLNWIPTDTTPEAALVQLEICRQLPPSHRLKLALQMSDTLRKLTAAGVRHRHPDYTDDQVRLAVTRIFLGEKLFREVYPGADVQP